jgi:multiple sugar transport system permease protein
VSGTGVPPLDSVLPPEEVEIAPPLGSLAPARRRGGGASLQRLRGRDRVVVVLMVAVPLLMVVGLVWVPAVVTVVLSFTNWDGIGDLDTIKWIGTQNYHDVFTIYPPFQPAIRNNLLFLGALFLVATPFGMFMAVLLDREIKGSRFYQTALYLPVVLSLALIGFIWQLIYSHDQGLVNGLFGTDVDWYGDPQWNIWAVLVASSWRHTGYIMLLYLAGLKGVDPTLREAAAMDGCNEARMFFRVIFPVMRPINVIILVITVIESLRAFDLVWVINKGRNGLELISALVTQNVIGEASRIGFGSALATIMLAISLVFIVIFLGTVVKEDR